MPVIQNDDKVWFDETIKLDHICNDVLQAQNRGDNVLLLSHFDAVLPQLSSLLRERQISHDQFSSLHRSQICASLAGKVWLGAARGLTMSSEMTTTTAGVPLKIIVAEHHPMRSRDQELIAAAATLICDTELCFYFSLDDPVMKHFGKASIQALFERLGIAKSECISHPLITTAIRTAQENIESKVGKDLPTHSVEDWFKYNLPDKQNPDR